MTQQLLSPRKVAEILDISRSNVYNHMGNGNIPYLMIGSCRRVKSSDLDKFITLQAQKIRANKTTKETV